MRVPTPIRRVATAGALGLAAASLASCGSAGQGLIPSANAGPLKGDFEEVAQAAQSGAGNCTATEDAIAKTQHDFGALPAAIDPGLRDRLEAGITNLRKTALEACAQPHTQTNATTTAKTTATSQSASTTSSVTETSTTETSASSTTSTPQGAGGTPAPGEGGEEGPGADHGKAKGDGKEKGNGDGHGEGRGRGRSGGASVGE